MLVVHRTGEFKATAGREQPTIFKMKPLSPIVVRGSLLIEVDAKDASQAHKDKDKPPRLKPFDWKWSFEEKRAVIRASAGQSCDEACEQNGGTCDPALFPQLNTCPALRRMGEGGCAGGCVHNVAPHGGGAPGYTGYGIDSNKGIGQRNLLLLVLSLLSRALSCIILLIILRTLMRSRFPSFRFSCPARFVGRSSSRRLQWRLYSPSKASSKASWRLYH
jgi:hypothetical protein